MNYKFIKTEKQKQLNYLLVPEIVLILLEEQANKISNKNKIKLVLRVLVYDFGFKKLHQQGGINIHKLI